MYMREVILHNLEGAARGIILLSTYVKGPPVGVLLVACILDTQLLLRNSDVKAEAFGKGKGAVRKGGTDFHSRKKCTRSERLGVWSMLPTKTWLSFYCENIQWAISCFSEWRSARNKFAGGKRLLHAPAS